MEALNESFKSHRAEKDDRRKKLFVVWLYLLGNCSTPKVLIFCKITGFTNMQLT